MKKIKGLLLGIISVLGISSVFADIYDFYNIEYFSSTSKINNYSFNMNNNRGLNAFTISGGSLVSYFPYYYSSLSTLNNNVFDLSNYSLGGGFKSEFFSYNRNSYLYNNNGEISLLFGPNYVNFPIVPGVSSVDNIYSQDVKSYIRVLNNNSNCFEFNSINGNCTNFLRSFIFQNTLTYDSARGIIHDSVYDGIDRKKGSISSSIYDNYSFTYALSGYSVNFPNITYDNGFVLFKTIVPTFSGSYYSFNNLYLIRLNNLYLSNSDSDFQVLAITFTGIDSGVSSSDTDFVYSLYDCPSNSRNIFNCSFNNGGYLRPSSLSNSFDSYNGKLYGTSFWFPTWDSIGGALKNFFFFLFFPNDADLGNFTLNFYNTYDSNSNIVQFYRLRGNSYNPEIVNYSLYLDSTSGIDIIDGVENPFPDSGGGGNDTPFVFDYNSLLINDMVICYISSGDVCPYNNFSMSGFENSFPVVNRLWDGVNGQLLMDSAKPYLTELCLNSDTINYAFCSQLDIYSGAFILFDYSNGILTYNILGDSFAVDVAVSNSGQLGSVGCYGAYCTNINVGATEYIINQDSGYYTGLFLSTGYYEDFLTLNKTGFFMKCPYSYENQNVVIGKNLLNKLGGFDILVPINCMIAGFNAGKSFTMIDWAGFKDLGPIMKFTDDYDGNHKILFTFIDVLLSVAIVVILMKLYHLFK